ncbi:MAG: hypothetical protein E7K79_04295 [Actinomyces urogenitalis]|nr:hypothetical protein [Actinomyces urogenitalis]
MSEGDSEESRRVVDSAWNASKRWAAYAAPREGGALTEYTSINDGRTYLPEPLFDLETGEYVATVDVYTGKVLAHRDGLPREVPDEAEEFLELLDEYASAGGLKMGPFWELRIHCGFCAIKRNGKRCQSRKVLGYLSRWADGWRVGRNTPVIGDNAAVDPAAGESLFFECPSCSRVVIIEASISDFDRAYLYRSRAQWPKRTSLRYLINKGFATEVPF